MSLPSKWSAIKKVIVALAAGILILLIATTMLIASEWTYIQRIRHFQKNLPTPPEWYEPKEIVAGVPAARALPRRSAPEAGISTNVIAQALERAVAGKASAFLVLKN